MYDMGTMTRSDTSVIAAYMRKVYQWMAGGLGLTGLVAWNVAGSQAAVDFIFGNSMVFYGLMIAQIGAVVVLSFAIHRMSALVATALFLLYSTLTGLTVASIFLIYPMGAIANAFLTAAGTFLAMSIYGSVTKRDLSGMGTFMFMGLIGVFIASLVNIFLQSSMMDFIISCVGVIVFTGLTAYDTQKIREFGANAPLHDAAAMRKGVILGALTLYLDFINLFLMLLRLMGGNRD